MNPHAQSPTSLLALLRSLWQHRALIFQMAQREVVGRYRGSLFGLAWSFFNPVLMLSVYTFVFSVVFKARWGELSAAPESRIDFAIPLFVGMLVHGLFAEVLNRAPMLIVSNPNFVKRVVFPLEILPVVALVAGLFHTAVNVLVVLLVFAGFHGYLPLTVLCVPLVLMPLVLMILGLAWALSSLGVYLRDVGQTIGLLTTVLMFLAPVFYPVNALPEPMRPWLMLNPLTFIIEQSRAVLLWGKWPDWSGLAAYTAVAVLVAWLGFAWFQQTRKGFADVL
jgi:lipopolysaccharide transport system permease protein